MPILGCYALGRAEPWRCVYSVLRHKPDYPVFGIAEPRYCLKFNCLDALLLVVPGARLNGNVSPDTLTADYQGVDDRHRSVRSRPLVFSKLAFVLLLVSQS